jgi:putative PIN family toxin of toxin-antitoxin system
MIRAVIDTNVLVSGLIKPDGPTGAILQDLRQGRFTVVFSSGLLQELVSVLTYPKLSKKYRLDRSAMEAFLALLALRGDIVIPGPRVRVCRDPDDDALFEAAIAGRADYIISGDSDVLAIKQYEGIGILSPRAFTRALRSLE